MIGCMNNKGYELTIPENVKVQKKEKINEIDTLLLQEWLFCSIQRVNSGYEHIWLTVPLDFF